MRKIPLIFSITFFLLCSHVYAYWIWTPQSRKWTNPKYDAKEHPKTQLEFALGFFEEENYKKAKAEFNKLVHYYPKALEAAEAQYYIGVCWEKLGEPYEAFKDYQKVINKYPFSERINEIIEKEYTIGEKLLDEGVSFWQYVSGREHPVVEIFRAVIDNAPYSDYAPASYYKIGLFLKEVNSFSEAKEEFEKITAEYPQSEWANKAQYQIALCEYNESLRPDYDQKPTEDATKKFEEFVKVNPDAELTKEAKNKIGHLKEKDAEHNFVIAKFYEKQKEFESAQIYYRYVIKTYPESPWADRAIERLQVIEAK
ncbi:MAG: outer membrane protein assembly factor BamD [Candidatus Omnitrophota bacterium]